MDYICQIWIKEVPTLVSKDLRYNFQVRNYLEFMNPQCHSILRKV